MPNPTKISCYGCGNDKFRVVLKRVSKSRTRLKCALEIICDKCGQSFHVEGIYAGLQSKWAKELK